MRSKQFRTRRKNAKKTQLLSVYSITHIETSKLMFNQTAISKAKMVKKFMSRPGKTPMGTGL